MPQENPEPPAIAASAGPPCWADLLPFLKPLSWSHATKDIQTAETVFGAFMVVRDGTFWKWYYGPHRANTATTESDAKAYCQTDFELRVKSLFGW